MPAIRPNPPEIITWRIAGAFYWGIGWRSAICAGLPSGIRAFTLEATQFHPSGLQWLAILATEWAITLPLCLWVLKHVLTNGITGYRLTVRRPL